MTVAELIKILDAMPQQALVGVTGEGLAVEVESFTDSLTLQDYPGSDPYPAKGPSTVVIKAATPRHSPAS